MFNFLNWIKGEKLLTASFYLKSGSVIDVKCKNVKITRNSNSVDNNMTGYEIDGMADGTKLLYLNLDQVAAVTYTKN